MYCLWGVDTAIMEFMISFQTLTSLRVTTFYNPRTSFNTRGCRMQVLTSYCSYTITSTTCFRALSTMTVTRGLIIKGENTSLHGPAIHLACGPRCLHPYSNLSFEGGHLLSGQFSLVCTFRHCTL